MARTPCALPDTLTGASIGEGSFARDAYGFGSAQRGRSGCWMAVRGAPAGTPYRTAASVVGMQLRWRACDPDQTANAPLQRAVYSGKAAPERGSRRDEMRDLGLSRAADQHRHRAAFDVREVRRSDPAEPVVLDPGAGAPQPLNHAVHAPRVPGQDGATGWTSTPTRWFGGQWPRQE